MNNSRNNSQDEKEQKKFIKECCREIERDNPCLKLSLEDFNGISSGNGKCSLFISQNGELLPVSETRNHYNDSKALDGVSYFHNLENGNCLEVYFFCKYTVGQGGIQGSIPFEVKVTKDCISKNTDKNIVFAFMLEGSYWTHSLIDEAEFDGNKAFYVNKENMKRVLSRVLKAKKIL